MNMNFDSLTSKPVKTIPVFLAICVAALAYQASRYGWVAACVTLLFGMSSAVVMYFAIIKIGMKLLKNINAGQMVFRPQTSRELMPTDDAVDMPTTIVQVPNGKSIFFDGEPLPPVGSIVTVGMYGKGNLYKVRVDGYVDTRTDVKRMLEGEVVEVRKDSGIEPGWLIAFDPSTINCDDEELRLPKRKLAEKKGSSVLAAEDPLPSDAK